MTGRRVRSRRRRSPNPGDDVASKTATRPAVTQDWTHLQFSYTAEWDIPGIPLAHPGQLMALRIPQISEIVQRTARSTPHNRQVLAVFRRGRVDGADPVQDALVLVDHVDERWRCPLLAVHV